jgi:hypothetical protein
MRRIIASLFVVVAITGAGVLATGAYFQVKTEVDGVTFSAGTANIALAECEGVGCPLGTPDPAGGVVVPPGALPAIGPVGPGYTKTFCLAVMAIGYDLNITQRLSGLNDPHGLSTAIDLTIVPADGACHPTGPAIVSNTLNNYNGWEQPMATPLTVGGTAFFLETLSWNNAADQSNQNGLEGATLSFNAVIAGTTPH